VTFHIIFMLVRSLIITAVEYKALSHIGKSDVAKLLKDL